MPTCRECDRRDLRPRAGLNQIFERGEFSVDESLHVVGALRKSLVHHAIKVVSQKSPWISMPISAA